MVGDFNKSCASSKDAVSGLSRTSVANALLNTDNVLGLSVTRNSESYIMKFESTSLLLESVDVYFFSDIGTSKITFKSERIREGVTIVFSNIILE